MLPRTASGGVVPLTKWDREQRELTARMGSAYGVPRLWGKAAPDDSAAAAAAATPRPPDATPRGMMDDLKRTMRYATGHQRPSPQASARAAADEESGEEEEEEPPDVPLHTSPLNAPSPASEPTPPSTVRRDLGSALGTAASASAQQQQPPAAAPAPQPSTPSPPAPAAAKAKTTKKSSRSPTRKKAAACPSAAPSSSSAAPSSARLSARSAARSPSPAPPPPPPPAPAAAKAKPKRKSTSSKAKGASSSSPSSGTAPAASAASSATVFVQDPTLPPGWKAVSSPGVCTYYIHPETGKRRVERPQLPPPPPPLPPELQDEPSGGLAQYDIEALDETEDSVHSSAAWPPSPRAHEGELRNLGRIRSELDSWWRTHGDIEWAVSDPPGTYKAGQAAAASLAAATPRIQQQAQGYVRLNDDDDERDVEGGGGAPIALGPPHHKLAKATLELLRQFLPVDVVNTLIILLMAVIATALAVIASRAAELGLAATVTAAISVLIVVLAAMCPSPADDNEKDGDDGPQEEALPKGWEQVLDKESGRVYYFHSVTRATTWDRPTAADTVLEMSPRSVFSPRRWERGDFGNDNMLVPATAPLAPEPLYTYRLPKPMPASDSCGARLYAFVQHAVATDIQLSVGIFGLASLAIASIAAPYGVGTWILLYYAASIQLLETVIWAFRWMPCVGSLITLSEEMQTRMEVMHRQCMQPIEQWLTDGVNALLHRNAHARVMINAIEPRKQRTSSSLIGAIFTMPVVRMLRGLRGLFDEKQQKASCCPSSVRGLVEHLTWLGTYIRASPFKASAAIASLVLLRSSGFVAPAARLSATAPRAEAVSTEPEWEVTMSGLKFVDDKVGDGEQPEKGSIVRVEYTGWLAASDFKFDSSVDRGVPFTFEIGKGNVIPGWDEGVSTMRVGGKRTMLIPSRLAYGEENIAGGLIPPNSDLRFECELVECNTGALAGMAVGAKDQITGLTGAFGANPFTFFALLLVVTIVGPYVLPEDSPLMK